MLSYYRNTIEMIARYLSVAFYLIEKNKEQLKVYIWIWDVGRSYMLVKRLSKFFLQIKY